METQQLLERFRNLSRTLQANLQIVQKEINSNNPIANIEKTRNSLQIAMDTWDDFSGWITISTLDSDDDIKSLYATGDLSTLSKITRARHKQRQAQQSKGIKFNLQEVKDITITTYLPLFEQMLDLIIQNAAKYSPSSGCIDISCSKTGEMVCIEISSTGPFLEQAETEKIGQKEFRGKHAITSKNSGSGYGVYNAIRIANILKGSISFTTSNKPFAIVDEIPMGNFTAKIKLPLVLE